MTADKPELELLGEVEKEKLIIALAYGMDGITQGDAAKIWSWANHTRAMMSIYDLIMKGELVPYISGNELAWRVSSPSERHKVLEAFEEVQRYCLA